MTREEQIIEASQLYAKHQQKPFMDGARWADQNPVNYDGKAMLHVLNKGAAIGRREMLDKACEWLNNFYNEDTHSYLVKEDIEGFRKAMEEQQ